MYSFGVGSLLDLPHFSAIIAGLDEWNETNQIELTEERLLAAIRAEKALNLGHVRRLRSAPWQEETSSPFESGHGSACPSCRFRAGCVARRATC
jgi:hypothetical protein